MSANVCSLIRQSRYFPALEVVRQAYAKVLTFSSGFKM